MDEELFMEIALYLRPEKQMRMFLRVEFIEHSVDEGSIILSAPGAGYHCYTLLRNNTHISILLCSGQKAPINLRLSSKDAL